MEIAIILFVFFCFIVHFVNILSSPTEDNKVNIEQNGTSPNKFKPYTFQDVFHWDEIEKGVYQLKTIPQEEVNIYIIVRHINKRYIANNGEYINYKTSNIDIDIMFNFEITKDINTKGEKYVFYYPSDKGIIQIQNKNILSVISKNDISTLYSKIKLENDEPIMTFDCRTETNEMFEKIKEQERLETIAKEKKEREEREEREIRQKILERERKKRKEKEIYNRLLDEGLIYPDESNKRPPIPRDVVDAVWRRDGGKCVYCGSTENLQLDHIIPFSKGGATNFENLQLLCQKCNLKKSNNIG